MLKAYEDDYDYFYQVAIPPQLCSPRWVLGQ
jgi:hypothetical protein